MGTEFLSNTRKSASKYLDRRRAELCAPDLFRADPETVKRQYLAKSVGRTDLRAGDKVQIEREGAGIVVRQAGRVIGRTENPAPGLKRTVDSAGGFFPGSVSSVHAISATFEFCVAPPVQQGKHHAQR